jgi:hypothetical protein
MKKSILGDETEGGITIGTLLQETRPGTPVLYTSGRLLTDEMKSLFVEPNAFLPKPYTAPELKEAIDKMLESFGLPNP